MLGARPKIRAEIKPHDNSDAFKATNPDYTLSSDVSWIKSPDKPATPDSDLERSYDRDEYYDSSKEEFDGVANASFFSNASASTIEDGVTVRLSYEPLLLQSLAINVDSAFHGPEMDPIFTSYSDAGFSAQYTAAVVVDSLQADLRYILIPLKNGVTIRISVDAPLNLKWFEFCERTRREDRALRRVDFEARKNEYRRKVEELKWGLIIGDDENYSSDDAIIPHAYNMLPQQSSPQKPRKLREKKPDKGGPKGF